LEKSGVFVSLKVLSRSCL